jgi:hypothetical protein
MFSHSSMWASLCVGLLCCPLAMSQAPGSPSLELDGVVPGGVRTSATESWGAYDFSLTNRTDTDRSGRVLVLFAAQRDVQYGRDVWVPAHAKVSSWMLVGPVVGPHPEGRCEVEELLYDRSADAGPILPRGEARVRSRAVSHRPREPFTAVLLDEDIPPPPPYGQLPQPPSTADEVNRVVRVFRHACNLSEFVQQVNPGPLPPLSEAFAGVDHFVVASNRLTHDPAGMAALRRWVEQGGKVWVLLDRVDPEGLVPLLGDALDFQVVERARVTTVTFQLRKTREQPAEHERPIDFVHVLLPAGEQVKYTVGGWPAWFSRPLGRGEVVFTTLGPRAWYRPRTRKDDPSPYQKSPAFPVPLPAMKEMAIRLQPLPGEPPFQVESLRPLLTEEIGYAVIDRRTVLLIFSGFLLAGLGLGFGLRRSRWAVLLGWLAPAVALGATGVFLLLGGASRRTPPTVAVAEVVDAISGRAEVVVHGLLAAYRPESGAAEAGARQGGFFDLDLSGSEGQIRRRILTDLGAWHWEGLTLPAGVRSAPFRYTAATQEPLRVTARFGPDGVEGELSAGPFRELSDALLSPAAARGGLRPAGAASGGGRNLAVRLQEEGRFRAGTADILPAGQFLASAVLTDRQQRRQDVYRAFLERPVAAHLQGRDFLLAWARPIDPPFSLVPEARTVGSALLVVPLQLERPAAGTRVTIPGPFLACQRIMPRGMGHPVLESVGAVDMHLRFQLPAEVLPFQVERARLFARINAPARRVTVGGFQGEDPVQPVVPIRSVESPLDPLHIDLTEPGMLRLDEGGGLHVNVAISDRHEGGLAGPGASAVETKWTIEGLELEVSGRPTE